MKWFGEIGYAIEVNPEPGIYENKIITKRYYGDVLRNYKKDSSNSTINNNYRINNQISVLSDPFLNQNFHKIVFITFMGTKWNPSTIEVSYPRLIFELGDIYNEEGSSEGGECDA